MNLSRLRVRVLIPLSLLVAILLASFTFILYESRQDHIDDLRMTILLVCGVCLLIGGTLFLLFHVYMGRVEKQLDITKKAFYEKEEEYLNILNSLEDSYFEMNLAGNITFFSPSVGILLRYPDEELMGANFHQFIDPSMANEVSNAFNQVYRTGMPERHLLADMVTKDGRTLNIEMSVSQLKDANNQIIGFFGIGRDMSERKRAASELQRAKEAADAANRSKSVFLANMSHEIRTPMNAILGFAQLMQRDPNLTPQSREHLDIINRSGEHLLALINDILEMSKIEAGRAIFVPNTFDLHSLLNDIELMFRVQTDTKNLRFLMEMVGDVPRWVKTDEGKLRQIIINLLGNAVKFTEEGGIVLRLCGKIENADMVNLLFEVEDTGPGMTDEEIGRLFKAFEQTKSGITIGGTGLGLALSRGFVEIMGGTISVISTVDKGTIFRFNIRVQQASEEQVSPKETKRRVLRLGPGQGEIRVLIADDRETNRQLLSQMLAAVGFAAREAVNGLEVVQITHEWKPRLILMDMAMPIMDGYEATRTIKASPDIMNTVIIAVTASAFEEDKQRVFAVGADGYLSKPFKECELFEIVGRLTGAEYLYEDATDGARASATVNEKELLQKTVASLPPDLVNRLRNAVESADVDLLGELAGKLVTDHPTFVHRIQEMAARYEYDALIELFSPGA
jgi:two-component system sensor histidine kinase/response regulator